MGLFEDQDGFEHSEDTVIGNDVWIGTEAIIMSGIKVGVTKELISFLK